MTLSVGLPPLPRWVLGVWSGGTDASQDPHLALGPQCHPSPCSGVAAVSLECLPRVCGPHAIPRFSAIRLRLISKASCLSCRACCAISSLATFEVMMKMASLQSMVLPFPSVSRPWEETAAAWSGSGKAGHLFQEVSPEPSPPGSQRSLLWGL